MRAIIYSRVSTDAQERDGTSLETQERACEALTSDRGNGGQGGARQGRRTPGAPGR